MCSKPSHLFRPYLMITIALGLTSFDELIR
ncbi:MAG: hypothetical protein AVDCRST_MAG93-5352 [uncultured Chloroflexia bacterium]|uniref:Uncharacterized protein n=1 Tax=uncultured Chloroflexia bacterium TaxID=1672391 RepID=A0A6J4KTJ1_9CHLR|nr:MAG: hypothetical protein AVDCRST_MAG93-5352 [uncultured Chloroflexia bacterium]